MRISCAVLERLHQRRRRVGTLRTCRKDSVVMLLCACVLQDDPRAQKEFLSRVREKLTGKREVHRVEGGRQRTKD